MSGRPSKELLEALENLQVFSDGCNPLFFSSLPCLQGVNGKVTLIQQSALKNILCYFKALFFMVFYDLSSLIKKDVYQIVIRSCAVIKKNAILVYLWEDGSSEERRFAFYVKTVVDRFNRVVEEIDGMRRVFSFTQRQVEISLTKIDMVPLAFLNKAIPSVSSTQYNPLKMFTKQKQEGLSPLNTKVSRLRESFLPLQAHELFMMKAISLLEKKGIASHEEARLMTRGNAICTAYDEEKGIHTMTLTLQPSPERVIEIQGAFLGRIPLADCFQITIGLKAAI